MANVHVRTLTRAAELAGGEEQLAVLLKVTPSHLRLWMTGYTDPPADVFLRAADLVLGQSPPGMASDPVGDGDPRAEH